MSYVNEGMLSEVGILGNREYEDSPDSFIQISQASGEGLKLYVCFEIKKSIAAYEGKNNSYYDDRE